MKSTKLLAGAAALIALAGCNKQGNEASNAPVKLEQVKPPPGSDWTQVVSQTAQGGFMMGNPNAKVKLIEIGSLSCPHCRAFEDEGVPTLVSKYVKSGQVSWEFRPYLIHGPVDMAADLIARCNGEKSFFPIVQAMYKDQPVWMGKVEAAPQDKLAQIQNLPTNQLFVAMANVLGLPDWAALRGIPQAKSNQCLSDQKMIDQEVQVSANVNSQYPEFTGTPAFVINGKMLKDTAGWDKLEPQLKDALR